MTLVLGHRRLSPALAALAATNLFRTGLGRAFVAIRDQDIAAEVIGVDPFRYKLLAFAISSAFVGLAGALTAHYNLIVTWERFTLDVSILYLAMIIVGGLGSRLGRDLRRRVHDRRPGLDRGARAATCREPRLPAGRHARDPAADLRPRRSCCSWSSSRAGSRGSGNACKDYFRLWPFRY